MQDDLADAYPELDIQILGVNEFGFESANGQITSEVDIASPGPDGVEGNVDDVLSIRDIPWLQDVDADGNGISDVWYDSWQVTYRDVVVLDSQNQLFGVFNVTGHNLSDPANYDTLRQIFIDAATSP